VRRLRDAPRCRASMLQNRPAAHPSFQLRANCRRSAPSPARFRTSLH
jgi:hypothetical protein